MDELNLIKDLDGSSGSSAEATELAQFIKENFLAFKGRYFVFSSHVVYTLPVLSNFVESTGNRKLIAPEMPIIPSVTIASSVFDAPHLNARDVLLYGRIPALLSEALRHSAASERRGKAIDDSLSELESNGIKYLMSSFITGDYHLIPRPLLQLMDTFRQGSDLYVRWIPYHMLGLFDRLLYAQIDDLTKRNLMKIVKFFKNTLRVKGPSRDGWEPLFVIGLMIRCMASNFNTSLLPILSDYEFGLSFSVSLNQNLEFMNDPIRGLNSFEDLIEKMNIPSHLPHISIYYGSHLKFEPYDVIIAKYASNGRRKIFGYQLKQGKSLLPQFSAHSKVDKSFVILDFPTKDNSESLFHGWHIADLDEIYHFFGVSGRYWTSKDWAAFTEAK